MVVRPTEICVFVVDDRVLRNLAFEVAIDHAMRRDVNPNPVDLHAHAKVAIMRRFFCSHARITHNNFRGVFADG